MSRRFDVLLGELELVAGDTADTFRVHCPNCKETVAVVTLPATVSHFLSESLHECAAMPEILTRILAGL